MAVQETLLKAVLDQPGVAVATVKCTGALKTGGSTKSALCSCGEALQAVKISKKVTKYSRCTNHSLRQCESMKAS
jgi:hypothetical protein